MLFLPVSVKNRHQQSFCTSLSHTPSPFPVTLWSMVVLILFLRPVPEKSLTSPTSKPPLFLYSHRAHCFKKVAIWLCVCLNNFFLLFLFFLICLWIRGCNTVPFVAPKDKPFPHFWVKFRFSEKATKIWKNLPLVLMLLSKRQNKISNVTITFWNNPIHPLLYTWINTWTEPDTHFG